MILIALNTHSRVTREREEVEKRRKAAVKAASASSSSTSTGSGPGFAKYTIPSRDSGTQTQNSSNGPAGEFSESSGQVGEVY